MSVSSGKIAVFRQLSLEINPISLKDLLRKLGPEFKDRSVRRWLVEWVNEDKIQKFGNKRGAKYQVLFSIEKKIVFEAHRCFSATSLDLIELIRKPLFERQPVSYKQEWLDNYRPNIDFYLSLTVRQQLHQAGSRSFIQDPAGTYAHQIFNRLLIDLSYNSSRLEGNTYSLLDTERLLLHGDSPEGKMDEEKIMILNHKEAIRYLVDNIAKIGLNRNVICTLHYLLSDGLVDSSESGKVRKYGVRIGGSVYLPLEGARNLDFLLEKITLKASLIEDPFEQSIFLLAHISYLQAFVDVNKRTSRISANIPLVKNNLVPLAFNDIPVDEYMSAMIAVYELQQMGPLIDLYFFSYLRTCALYDSTVQAIGFDVIRVKYRQQRRNLITLIISEGVPFEKIDQYIHLQAAKLVTQEDQKFFIEDVKEDLDLLDESRIAGLGIDLAQLSKWQTLISCCKLTKK